MDVEVSSRLVYMQVDGFTFQQSHTHKNLRAYVCFISFRLLSPYIDLSHIGCGQNNATKTWYNTKVFYWPNALAMPRPTARPCETGRQIFQKITLTIMFSKQWSNLSIIRHLCWAFTSSIGIAILQWLLKTEITWSCAAIMALITGAPFTNMVSLKCQ